MQSWRFFWVCEWTSNAIRFIVNTILAIREFLGYQLSNNAKMPPQLVIKKENQPRTTSPWFCCACAVLFFLLELKACKQWRCCIRRYTKSLTSVWYFGWWKTSHEFMKRYFCPMKLPGVWNVCDCIFKAISWINRWLLKYCIDSMRFMNYKRVVEL